MRPWKTLLAALVLTGVALAVPAEVRSAVRLWDNDSGDHDWYNGVNWNPDGSPDPADELGVFFGTPHAALADVITDGDGSITIDGAETSATFDLDLIVGSSGTGTLTVQNNGAVTVANTLKLSNAGTVNHNGGLIVADTVELTGGTFTSAAGSTLRVNALDGFGDTVSLGGSLELGHAGGSGSGSYSVGAGQSLATGEGLAVGYDASFTLNVTNGDVVNNSHVRIGGQSGSQGTVTVDGTEATWTNSGHFYVGNLGTGTLDIIGGGNVSNGSGHIGYETGSQGTATVDGSGSTWTHSGNLYVGNEGSGTLNIANGGEVAVGYATTVEWGPVSTGMIHFGPGGGTLSTGWLCASPGHFTGTGTVDTRGLLSDVDLVFDSSHGLTQTLTFNETGQNVTVNLDMSVSGNAGWLGAGYQGSGSLAIRDGLTVESRAGYIGHNSGSTGAATVDGDGSTWNSGTLCVGYKGTGTLDITGGGSVSNADGYIGRYSDSVGTVTVDGTESTWNNSGNLYVGYEGTGTLDITGGGSVSNSYGYIGRYSDSVGTVTVDGTGTGGTPSTWNNSGYLYVGYEGTGTLDITGGGSVSNFSGYIGRYSDSVGTVTVDGSGTGGTPSTWNNTYSLYVGYEGTGTLDITGGGSVSNSSGYIGRYSDSVGTVTVDGTGSEWNNSGSLYVGGGLSAAGGTGTLTVQDDGTVDATNTLKVWDTVVNQNGGLIVADTVELTGGGTFTSAAGSTLRVNALSGFGDTVSLGGSLDLGHAGGSGSGSYSVGAGQSLVTGEGLAVGYDGSFTLNVTDGGVVNNSLARIGWGSGSLGSVRVEGTDSTWTNTAFLTVAHTGEGHLVIADGGSVGTWYGSIGLFAGSLGTVTVEGNGSQWTNYSIEVGRDGTGTLDITDGGSVDVTAMLQVGSNGTLTLDGGRVACGDFDNTSGGAFNHRDGIFTIDGGAFNPGTADYTIDGADSDDLPTVKLTGGAMCELTGQMKVGTDHAGALEIRSGSSLQNTIGYVGYTSDLDNRVTVDGTGATGTPSTWTNTSYLCVGRIGTGTLEITGGGRVVDPDGYIASQPGSDGTVTVDGAAAKGTPSTWDNSGVLLVGASGTGRLTITAGGSVLTGTQGYIAREGGSTGTATISGTGSDWDVGDSLFVGGSETAAGGTGTLTVRNNGAVTVTNTLKVWNTAVVNLDQGTIEAATLELAGGSLQGRGTVLANVTGGSTITADGGTLTLGNGGSPDGFDFSGTLIVQSDATAELLDGDAAQLGPQTTLNNGALIARNGVVIDTGETIEGYGIVVGTVSGSGSLLMSQAPTGTVQFHGVLPIGSATAVIYSVGVPQLCGPVELAGGAIQSANGLVWGTRAHLTGFGSVTDCDFLALAGSTVTAEGGDLSLGDANSYTGFSTEGNIGVGTHTITLNSKGFANLGALTTIEGGTLAAPNGLTLGVGDNLQGNGTVNAAIFADGGSVIDATGNLAVGDGTAYDGFFSDGRLYINASTVSLNDANEAVLGSLTQMASGELQAAGGLLIEQGKNLVGNGTVSADLVNDGHVVGDSPAAPIVFAVGYTVSGNGTFENVEFQGKLAPGYSLGTVRLRDVVFGSQAQVETELDGPVPGSGHDQLDVVGQVDLGGAALDALLGYAPGRGDRFVIINNRQTNPIIGQFAGLPDNSRFMLDGYRFGIDYQGGDGNDVALFVPVGEVTGRHVFYNNSSFDGRNATADEQDDLAIAPDKAPLMPGETAAFDNYTSFSQGINGVIVDILDLCGMPTEEDFLFKIGNSDDPDSWSELLGSPSITVREGEGAEDADRVTLIWDDNLIQKQWLQITVLANGNTGLLEDDVFYFGNAVGESGNSATDTKVNAYDMLGARDNQRTFIHPATLDFPYDYNRDARVNAYDMLIARDNQTHFLNDLNLITVPGKAADGSPAAVPEPATLLMLAGGVVTLILPAIRRRRSGKRG